MTGGGQKVFKEGKKKFRRLFLSSPPLMSFGGFERGEP